MPTDNSDHHVQSAHTIAREDLANLPLRRHDGTVHIVATSQAMTHAMADIRQQHVVGFDTETRPAFRQGERYLPSLAQIATANAVYILMLRAHEVLPGLAELLQAPHIAKAGVALAHDLRMLREVVAFAEHSVIDLGFVARRNGCKQTGVRNLAGLFLGYRIPKGARTTNWAASRLTPAQIAYAATDAWVCRELHLEFETKGWIDKQSGASGLDPRAARGLSSA